MGGVEWYVATGMAIGPDPHGYAQKIPAMGRAKPCFHGSGFGSMYYPQI